jgi:hypothetical protein
MIRFRCRRYAGRYGAAALAALAVRSSMGAPLSSGDRHNLIIAPIANVNPAWANMLARIGSLAPSGFPHSRISHWDPTPARHVPNARYAADT